MPANRIAVVLFALCVVGSCQLRASAQGGWRQWDMYMLDGTKIEANPLQMRADGRFTRSMGEEPGFERSKINYLAASTKSLPPAPDGTFKQDLVVMLDGTRTFGTVTFRDVKFSEGTIVQNGKAMTLENVAYVKFAHPKQRVKRKK